MQPDWIKATIAPAASSLKRALPRALAARGHIGSSSISSACQTICCGQRASCLIAPAVSESEPDQEGETSHGES